jgi:hypothetical protein
MTLEEKNALVRFSLMRWTAVATNMRTPEILASLDLLAQ